jgi:hypothetical protein
MSDQPAPNAPHLWNVLRFYLRRTCGLFGEPADLARGAFLTRTQHRHICEWLRPMEALLRRLLYLMARLLKREPAPHAAKTRAPRTMNASFRGALDVDNSEAWRVSFNAHTERRRPRRHRSTHAIIAGEGAGVPSATEHQDRIPAAPVAMRLEALIRVTLDPQPYAEKLADKLAREQEPPYALLTVSPRRASPLYEPARDAAALICRAIAEAPPACADTS